MNDPARNLSLADECDRWAAALEADAGRATNPAIRAWQLEAAAGARRDAVRLRAEVGEAESDLVREWKHLDAQATEHMNRWNVGGSNQPCPGCAAPTCTYVAEVSRRMRELYARMSAAEQRQC